MCLAIHIFIIFIITAGLAMTYNDVGYNTNILRTSDNYLIFSFVFFTHPLIIDLALTLHDTVIIFD